MAKNKGALSFEFNEIDLKKQVDNYEFLKIGHSIRKFSVLVTLPLLFIYIILDYIEIPGIGRSKTDALPVFLVYLPIIYFFYKGKRWAMITWITVFSIDQLGKIIITLMRGGAFIPMSFHLGIWTLYLNFYFKALQVENKRKENQKIQSLNL